MTVKLQLTVYRLQITVFKNLRRQIVFVLLKLKKQTIDHHNMNEVLKTGKQVRFSIKNRYFHSSFNLVNHWLKC